MLVRVDRRRARTGAGSARALGGERAAARRGRGTTSCRTSAPAPRAARRGRQQADGVSRGQRSRGDGGQSAWVRRGVTSFTLGPTCGVRRRRLADQPRDMERLWSRADANGRNSRQRVFPEKPPTCKQPRPVASARRRPEMVRRGSTVSSPSEGFIKMPANRAVGLSSP